MVNILHDILHHDLFKSNNTVLGDFNVNLLEQESH